MAEKTLCPFFGLALMLQLSLEVHTKNGIILILLADELMNSSLSL